MPVPESITGKVTKQNFLDHAVEINLKATTVALDAHRNATTNVHGVANTADLVLSTTIDNIVSLTQAAYDALATKDPATLYVIV